MIRIKKNLVLLYTLENNIAKHVESSVTLKNCYVIFISTLIRVTSFLKYEE